MESTTKITIQNPSQSKTDWIESIVVGERTNNFLDKFLENSSNPSKSKQTLLEETKKILNFCGNPNSDKNFNNVNLAIGYVQSGKTASFTTLTSLAQENGYKIIIILAGVATNLVSQTNERLEEELESENLEIYDSKTISDENIKPSRFQHILNSDDSVVITLLKDKTHFTKIINLLKDIHGIENQPTLIIDDEADQASQNTKEQSNAKTGKDEVSRTYEMIQKIRDIFLKCSTVLYTATPQVSLFLDKENNYKPDFFQLLTPGEGYTGGKYFVQERGDFILRKIPSGEIPSNQNDVRSFPESLKKALLLFIVGSLDFVFKKRSNPEDWKKDNHRSMMVHPSQLKGIHKKYFKWINTYISEWERAFLSEQVDILKSRHKELESAFDDLDSEIDNLEPITDLLSKDNLTQFFRVFNIQEVNTGDGNTTSVNWKDKKVWVHILIGGNSLSRGYTVSGLTVTYLPRKKSNADTTMQWARFYGYKEKYANFCRIFMPTDSIKAFKGMVDDEEYLRTFLSENSNKNLKDLEIKLQNKANLQPTNFARLRQKTQNLRIADWIRVSDLSQEQEDDLSNNLNIYEHFKAKFNSEIYRDSSFLFNGIKPERIDLELESFIQNVFNQLKYKSSRYATLKNALETFNKNENITIYFMNSINNNDLRRRSYVNGSNVISLFQGRNANYIGDGNILDKNNISIQFHNLNVFKSKEDEKNDINGKNILTLACWIPSRLANNYSVQTN